MTHLDRRRFLAISAALTASTALGQNRRAVDAPGGGSPLASGNTTFGLDLYGQLRSESGNLFLSPFSISTALGMVAAGARGKTLEEMTRVLHLPAHAS
ncbi:MAG TPA: serpin family protein, partial [Gemmata sp.]|nr:serpin family protein [Gemmata sp.]